ncbi:MAG TPA: 2,3-epoxybenzoyl-CoA dihydrolase [Myxococcota bacterium]
MAEHGNSTGLDLQVSFQTSPKDYKHWKLTTDGEIATLAMDVDEEGGLGDYVLKQNSYDLGVDVELWDAIERIRFEHPEVKSVVVTGLKDKVFCSGANIFMLGMSSHAFKVNFCKFTNETRLGIEDASSSSGLRFLAALNGTAAGGGYELALACDEILLLDDANSAVSFPEVPLLGVLPGTGGLTRITDKRKVRKDLSDVFSTMAEGVKGKRAVEWKLVDHLAPKSKWNDAIKDKANKLAATSTRPGAAAAGQGVVLTPIEPVVDGTAFSYKFVTLVVDPKKRTAEITLKAPTDTEPRKNTREKGSELWALRCYRELNDAILRLRAVYLEVGLITFRTEGSVEKLLAAEATLLEQAQAGDWFANEVLQHMKRVIKRVDVTSKTILCLVEPGSAWAGSFADLLLFSDRSYLLDDPDTKTPATITLTPMSLGHLPTGNGLSRLRTRFYGDDGGAAKLEALAEKSTPIEGADAEKLGVVTFARDDIDFPDEVRLFVEERTAMSPDALTGMEQNLRWPGPETMETRIFGRLSAWQNWIFTRPNSTGEKGALSLYGKPDRPVFDMRRT